MTKTNTGKILLIILVLFVAAILATYFLVLKQADKKENIDFIELFDSAEKTNFSEDVDINAFLSPKTYSIQNIIWDKLITLFSSKGKIINKNGQIIDHFSDSSDDTGFYLNFYYNPVDEREFQFISNKKGDATSFIIKLSTGISPSILIERIRNGTSEKIDNFKIPCNADDYNIFQVIKFDEILLVSLNKKPVFQMKNKTLSDISFQQFIPPHSGITRYILKKLEINKAEVEDLLEGIKNSLHRVPDHQFNLNSVSWNSLFPEYKIVNTSSVSQYLRRLNLDGTTRPSIYFPINSSLEYNVTLPEGSTLDFALAAIPDYFTDSTQLKFKIKISECYFPESYIMQEFKFDKITASQRKFDEISIPLNKLSNKKVKIVFSASLLNHYPQSDEKKILTVLGSPAIYSRKEKPEKPNVILVILDTLRADHLGCYGCKVKDISPNIDSFASESALMENTMSNSSWTLPSHMSLFTSLFPGETGYRKSAKGYNYSRFAENVKLFSEYLKESGYKTAAITGGSYVSSSFGFDRGFSSYYENYEDMSIAMEGTLQWLQNNRDKKFFLFFHTYETHEPYKHSYYLDQAPSSNLSANEKTELKYNSGIRYADAQFGRLIDWLKKNDLFDNTIIILTSDHGEKFDKLKLDSLGNYAGTHGFTLYDRVTHVPLIIRGPAPFDKPLKIKAQTSLVDIMPTILSSVGIEASQPYRGTDLAELVNSKDKKAERIAFAEATRGRWDRKALRTNDYKFITSADTEGMHEKPTKELYNLKEDPNEIKNIQDFQKKTVIAFAKKLEILLNSILDTQRRLKIRDTGELSGSSDLMKTLEGLGYIHEM
ncbi:MAG: sulfatase [Acidobacteria bacterium]|nr:sulfatase [Acidobacteriota bacterium]